MSEKFSTEKLKIYWDKLKVAKFNTNSFKCEHHCLKTRQPINLGKPYQVA